MERYFKSFKICEKIYDKYPTTDETLRNIILRFRNCWQLVSETLFFSEYMALFEDICFINVKLHKNTSCGETMT